MFCFFLNRRCKAHNLDWNHCMGREVSTGTEALIVHFLKCVVSQLFFRTHTHESQRRREISPSSTPLSETARLCFRKCFCRAKVIILLRGFLLISGTSDPKHICYAPHLIYIKGARLPAYLLLRNKPSLPFPPLLEENSLQVDKMGRKEVSCILLYSFKHVLEHRNTHMLQICLG